MSLWPSFVSGFQRCHLFLMYDIQMISSQKYLLKCYVINISDVFTRCSTSTKNTALKFVTNICHFASQNPWYVFIDTPFSGKQTLTGFAEILCDDAKFMIINTVSLRLISLLVFDLLEKVCHEGEGGTSPAALHIHTSAFRLLKIGSFAWKALGNKFRLG